MQRSLLRGVDRIRGERIVVQPPDDRAERVQIVRAGETPVAHLPHLVSQTGLIERVGVSGDGNFNCVKHWIGRHVSIDEQQRLRRRGYKVEQSAVIVVRRDIARFVRRDDEELVVRSGEQIVQLDLMGFLQHSAGRPKSKVAVGAITNHGCGGLIGRPPDDCFSELVRLRNIRHDRRHEIGPRRGGACRRRHRVLIGCHDGVAVRHLQAPVDGPGAGGGRNGVREHAKWTRCFEGEHFPARLGGTGDEDIYRRLSREVRVDQLDFDHIRRAIGAAIEEQHADTWQRQVTGDHQREILVNGRRINARVFDHVAGPHANDVFPRQRRAQADGFDVVNAVVARRVGHRLALVKLVAAINSAIRRFHLEIQIVDQCRNGAGKPRHVRVGEGDF